tara:strand:- start:171 stop:758 length:588 start_codon:yes stop_codon:yes gene_type:complete
MTNARTLGNIGRNADLEDGGGGLTLLSKDTITTAVSAVDITLPAAYTRYRLVLEGFKTENFTNCLRLSYDGGSTFATGTAYAYRVLFATFGASTVSYSGYSGDSAAIVSYAFGGSNTNQPYENNSTFNIINNAVLFSYEGGGNLHDNAGTDTQMVFTGRRVQTAKADTLRFVLAFHATSQITAGTISLYGYRETV